MNDRELLEEALHRLESYEDQFGANTPDLETINAIRTRLAEPEEAAKPAAWAYKEQLDQLKHEPYSLMWSTQRAARIPLYLHPPRPAVRLSDEEIDEIWRQPPPEFDDLVRDIEAAVLKKNGLEVKDEQR